MTRQTAAACLLALTLVVSSCSSSAPKDSAPVAVANPTPTPTVTPSASPEPAPSASSPEPSATPDVIETPDDGDPDDGASTVPDDLKDMLVPDDLKDVTADDMYSSGINDLMADVDAGNKGRKVGVCRTAAIIVSELTRTEIEERRASMTPEDVETLEDFIDQCGRILAS